MMILREIHENLCYYDKRNPLYDADDAKEHHNNPKWADKCYCENCFYGRHKLALEILKYMDK